jgi:hypothetical protein
VAVFGRWMDAIPIPGWLRLRRRCWLLAAQASWRLVGAATADAVASGGETTKPTVSKAGHVRGELGWRKKTVAACRAGPPAGCCLP